MDDSTKFVLKWWMLPMMTMVIVLTIVGDEINGVLRFALIFVTTTVVATNLAYRSNKRHKPKQESQAKR